MSFGGFSLCSIIRVIYLLHYRPITIKNPPLKTASGGQISEIGTILIVVIFSSSTFLGYLNSFKNHQKHHILPFEIGLRHSYIPKFSRLRRARYYLNSCHFSSFNIFQYYLNKAGVLNSNRTVALISLGPFVFWDHQIYIDERGLLVSLYWRS